MSFQYSTPVPILQRQISSAHFAELMEFYKLNPFGDEWYRTGVLCEVMAKVWGGNKSVRAEDFIPIERSRGFRTTVENDVAVMQGISAMLRDRKEKLSGSR